MVQHNYLCFGLSIPFVLAMVSFGFPLAYPLTIPTPRVELPRKLGR